MRSQRSLISSQTQHWQHQSHQWHHQIQEKLEEEKEEKGLSLDPPRSHLRLLHHHQEQQQQRHQHQHHHFYPNPFQSSRHHVEGEEEDQDQDQDQDSPASSNRDQLFHVHHHSYLQQQHQEQQQQQFYARLVSASASASSPAAVPGAQPLKKRSYLPSSSSSVFGEQSIEYARKIGENSQLAAAPSRLGMRGGGGGEIVEVQGGHIVRSTGRKDRHSKVCTAKGPRDRRVRLSAHTAIQFYDVQDRLGYDRPSKAVDWLIKKAKSAIDELAELPPWHPNTSAAAAAVPPEQQNEDGETQNQNHQAQHNSMVDAIGGSSNRTAMVGDDGRVIGGESSVQSLQHGMSQNPNSTSSFLPPSLDSDAIADTIKSFFPMGAAAQPPPPSQFHNYPPDLLSRTSSQSQDLRLSLQSFQDPNFLHQQHHQAQHHQSHEQALFSGAGSTHLGFDGSSAGWSEHHHHPAEMGRFQRMVSSSWNNAGADNTGGGGGGGGAFMFASPPAPQPLLQPLFGGQNQFFSQRGPLQSSNTSSIRAWMDPPPIAATSSGHHHQLPFPSSISGIGFASSGFSGFHIPARIQGEEEHDGINNKPSSASSDSRH